jgi:hypothetical protein
LTRVVVPGILAVVEVVVILLAVRTVESIGTIIIAISTWGGGVILNILLAVLVLLASAILVFLLPLIHIVIVLGEKVGEFFEAVVVLSFVRLVAFLGFLEFLESLFDGVLVGIDCLSDVSPGFTSLLHSQDLFFLLFGECFPLTLFILLGLLSALELRDSGLDILGTGFDGGADIFHGFVALGHGQYLLVLLLGEFLGTSLAAFLAIFLLLLGLLVFFLVGFLVISLLFGVRLGLVFFFLDEFLFFALCRDR